VEKEFTLSIQLATESTEEKSMLELRMGRWEAESEREQNAF
jgi:hypothetical protein